ncbi:MAG TPA: prephenate dehydrogenase/arogenate dehydrogenase family protein [Gemmatimonadales bacterium]|nr:prephenate dehydrogenase/arogenate dehydrogenase family protein [Gemmatimonadales bacterium]
MIPSTLGILGLGALGGSIARRAKAAGVPAVLGWSPEPVARGTAVRQGALDDALMSPRAVAERAELVVLALPPRATRSQLESLASLRSAALFTDTSPVKRLVVSTAERAGLGERFAGSHPLVHAEGGFDASRTDLFCGATIYVTPTRDGEGAAREIADFWESVCEAHVVMLDPIAHDAQLALTEQLPLATAVMLARLLAECLPAGASLPAVARDTTRAAAADPASWAEALTENRDQLLSALAGFRAPLEGLERALQAGDAAALQAWLEVAARWRRGIEGGA